MSNKLRLSVLGLGLVIIAAAVLAGCGETSTSVLYSTPNWLPDGRIICGKLVIKTSQQIYGGGISESRSYVAAFYPTGTGEVELFEGGGKEITCSPTGEMVAYIASYYDANGKYVDDGIQILDYSGNKVKLSNASKVKYLDWSPDATKLVYSDTSRDLYVINRDGTGKLKIATSAEAVAWRVGDEIIYIYNNGIDYLKIAKVNSNNSSNEVFAVNGNDPQKTNNGEIYYRGLNNTIKSIRTNGANERILVDNYDRLYLKLSFDNSMITSGAYGSDSGIWLMNIDGTGYKKIR